MSVVQDKVFFFFFSSKKYYFLSHLHKQAVGIHMALCHPSIHSLTFALTLVFRSISE